MTARYYFFKQVILFLSQSHKHLNPSTFQIIYIRFILAYPITITASDASSGSTIISLAVLMSLFPVMVILIYVMYKRRRKNQAIIVQEEEEKEEEEMIVMLDKTPETTVIEVNTFENYCLQPTFLTTLKTQFGVSVNFYYYFEFVVHCYVIINLVLCEYIYPILTF